MNIIANLKAFIFGSAEKPNEGFPADLAGYASLDAAKVLIQNWESVIADGNTDNLVSDIDAVISHLRIFQKRAYEVLPVVNGGLNSLPEEHKYFRTVFQIEVLSEGTPIEEDMDVYAIAMAIGDGDCSGKTSVVLTQGLSAKEAAAALESQGSDAGFFQGLDLIDEEPHIKVEYDTSYTGGNYSDVGDFAYIPVSLIDAFIDESHDECFETALHAAFRKLTHLDSMHIVNFNSEERFTESGEAIPE